MEPTPRAWRASPTTPRWRPPGGPPCAKRRRKPASSSTCDRLVTLSFWLTPPQAPRRFATWFFLAPAAEQPAVVVDEREIHEHRWYTPAAAMAARDAGHIELVAPTFTTLWWLAQRRDVASALADGGARPPERFMSRLAFGADGVRATLWEGDAGYQDGDLQRPGPRRRLWIDPRGWRVDITG